MLREGHVDRKINLLDKLFFFCDFFFPRQRFSFGKNANEESSSILVIWQYSHTENLILKYNYNIEDQVSTGINKVFCTP